MDKKYLDIEEIIEYLYLDKKIIVTDEYKGFLKDRNYISLINPYKELFAYGRDENKKHIYNEDTDFSKYLNCVKHDEYLSSILFDYISCFEKEFKNIIFDTICKLYANNKNNDIYCIRYIKEIRNFLLKYYFLFPLIKLTNYKYVPKPPLFCTNFYFVLSASKGYIKDHFHIKKKISVLLKIYKIGSGKDSNGNILIKHYINSHKNIPLWIIPNALTFGELAIIFGMLDKQSQTKIVSHFYNRDENDIDIKAISKFSSMLEKIRIIRNTISHYEPIYPLLFNIIEKDVTKSPLIKAIEFLSNNYKNSKYTNYSFNKQNVQKNGYNDKIIDTLNILEQIIQNKR